MINGEVAEIKQKTVDTKVGVDDFHYHLEGVFIITAFKMSSAVLNLRLCGSYNADNFLKAFDYYGLWDISPSAQRLLREYAEHQAKYHLNNKEKFSVILGDDQEVVDHSDDVEKFQARSQSLRSSINNFVHASHKTAKYP
jgi:hypothetical protein